MQNSDTALSQQIEDLLVARNLRGMKRLQSALTPGYYLRAARHLHRCTGTVLIGTGFPVDQTFETDGPVGALALYATLEALGATPIIACEPPLSTVLATAYRIHELTHDSTDNAHAEIERIAPRVILSIERPGISTDGRYYNMHGEEISHRTTPFDRYIDAADCPTIAIGDGGNEIGMGNVRTTLDTMGIRPATTACDELLVADVSNWGAYGLIALLSVWNRKDLLATLSPDTLFAFLAKHGAVDGVTRLKALTEDGLAQEEGERIIYQLRKLSGFA